MVGESPATTRRGASWRRFTTAAGFLADEIVDMRGCIVGDHACGEVALTTSKLEGSYTSGWATQGSKAWARWLSGCFSSLTCCIGYELALVGEHLSLGVRILLLVGPGREGRLRAVWSRHRSSRGARVLRREVGRMEAWQRR
jgi:hypothetical protein